MSKYLLYSDLHLRPERLQDCVAVLNEIGTIARRLKAEHGEITIINGGDTFNTRGLIHTSCFAALYEVYLSWFEEGFRQLIVVGNHDQEDKAGEIHPMKVFESFDGWIVADRPMITKDGVFLLPYMEQDRIEKALEGYSDIALGIVHWPIRGARRNSGNVDHDGVPVEWLSKFRNVFSGHYHYRNRIKNVQYIGSPLQQNFGEMGQEKGVLVYDSGSEKTEFIALKSAPQHHEIEVRFSEEGKAQYESPKACSPKDFIRVKVHGDAEQCTHFERRSLQGLVAASIKIEKIVSEKSFSRLNIADKELLSPVLLMEKYVQHVETSLDRDKLIHMGKELVCDF